MEENLISKKELLELTGISYGALYRWKRKRLIPEEWFIKKSTFTGPETFFPRDKVLERIEKIQEMKEQVSLDDLAKQFSGAPLDIQITVQQLLDTQIVSPALERMADFSATQELDFYGALYLCICDDLITNGHLSIIEADGILAHLLADYKTFEKPPVLNIYRKMGITFSILMEENSQTAVDGDAKLIVSVPTEQMWEVLKTKWGNEDERNEA